MQEKFFNLEIEQSILGAILVDNKYWESCHCLKEDCFSLQDHKEIFSLIKNAIEKKQPADPFYLSTLSPKHENYLWEMMVNSTKTGKSFEVYVSYLMELSLIRKVSLVPYKIKEVLNNFELGNSSDILNKIEKTILELRNENFNYSDPIHISKAMHDQLNTMDLQIKNPNGLLGLSIGYPKIDQLTSGLQPGQLIILAARPSMGKTALGLNIATNIINTGGTVLFFSMEMSMKEISSRILSSLTSVNQVELKTGNLSSQEWLKVSSVIEDLSNKSLYLDESAILTCQDISNKIRRILYKSKKIDLVIIDYLQLMSTPTRNKSDNRVAEVSELSRNLKLMAKEFNIPIIVLSQLNRAVEARADKRPFMSDLRESGALEQDADLILFIYRDEVYNPNSQWKGYAEIIVSKNRNGSIGTTKLKFNPAITTFTDFC